jgi:hypothetical protein
MKRFLHYTTALGVMFALSGPLAFADTTHDKSHAAKDKTHTTADRTAHDKTAKTPDRTDTSKMHDDGSHGADVNRSPAHTSPWAQGGNFLPGHTPGDNRLPIYTQQGAQHPQ